MLQQDPEKWLQQSLSPKMLANRYFSIANRGKSLSSKSADIFNYFGNLDLNKGDELVKLVTPPLAADGVQFSHKIAEFIKAFRNSLPEKISPELEKMFIEKGLSVVDEKIGKIRRAVVEELFRTAFSSALQRDDKGLSAAQINHFIGLRTQARESKNWAEADRIRDDLKAQGIILEDGAGGTTWKRA